MEGTISMEDAIVSEDLLDDSNIVCQTALSACESLITELSDEEKHCVVSSVVNSLPEEEKLVLAASLFENILENRDPKLAGYMPKDFIEKAVITAHTLVLNNAESNVLYNLVRGISCSQAGTQHLPLDSLAFSVVSLILSSLFESGCEEFHMSKNGDSFISWLDQICPNENPAAFLERMNKLLYPWDNVEYHIKSNAMESKMMLNVWGEYQSTFEQNEELGGVLETMVLEPAQKQIQLCVCSEQKHVENQEELDPEDSEDEEKDSKIDVMTDPMLGVVNALETVQQIIPTPDTSNPDHLDPDRLIKQEQEDSDMERVRQKTIRYVCHLCDKSHDTKELLLLHMEDVHYQQSDGNFKCPECGDLFSAHDYARLLQHELQHNYKCDDCRKMFSRRMELDRHMKLHELSETTCTQCREVFPSKASMMAHRQSHDKATFECSYCTETFTQMRILRYHVAQIHPDQPQQHICSECDKVYFSPKQLQRHLESAHGDSPITKIQCDVCPKTFKRRLALEGHKQRVHGITPVHMLSCPQCDETFLTKVKLIKHKAAVHNGGLKTYGCEHCAKLFVSLRLLREHRRAEHPEVASAASGASAATLQCAQCNERFRTTAQRLRHERLYHGSGRIHACTECPAKFGDKYALERHTYMKHGDGENGSEDSNKRYQCRFCGGRYYTARHLARHVAHIHEGKPARRNLPPRQECPDCGKTFVDKRFLHRHQQREHLGRTDFDEQTCPICGQRFSGKSSLNRHHRRIHRGIKDHTSKEFQCEYCAKTFMFKQSLQRHMQSTHKLLIPQFECPACHKFFVNEFNLRKHQENQNCKPRKKRQKLNIPQNIVNLSNLGDKTQFIEIQVVDTQNFQNSVVSVGENMENIENLNLTSLPPGATWSLQGQTDAATGEDATYQVTSQDPDHPDDTHFEQSEFILQEHDTGEGDTELQQIHHIQGAEVEAGDPQMFISDGQGFVSGDAIEQIGLQGNVVEVPMGVKFIQLGEKFVRLDGGV